MSTGIVYGLRRARQSSALAAAVVAGLLVASSCSNTPAAAPTAVNASATTIALPPVTPTTTLVGAPSTTLAPAAAPEAFDPNALPEPITTTPGSWLWTAPAAFTLADATVAGDITVAVIQDASGSTTAVGLRDGTELWRHPLPAHTSDLPGLPSSIISAGDTVVVAYDVDSPTPDQGLGDLGLTSLNAADGAERWSQRLATASLGHMSHGPDDIIVLNASLVDDAQAAAFDATDGHFLWDRNTANAQGGVTAIRADRVVMTDWRDNLTNVVDIRTGQVLFEVDGQYSALAEPVLYTMNGGFSCEDPTCVLQGYDATTGATMWQGAEQNATLAGTTADGAVIVATYNGADANPTGQLTVYDSSGAQRWSIPGCADAGVLHSDPVGTLVYCSDGLTLRDNGTGSVLQQIQYNAAASNALADDETLYTVIESQVTATTLAPGGAALWSVGIPGGFRVSSSFADDSFFNPYDREASAFDHRLLIAGHVAGGRAALAVLTDLPFTPPVQPVLTLDEITTGAGIVGHVGPYTMPDGTQAIVLTRGDTVIGQSETGGTVELAVERADGWHIDQVLEQGSVTAPVEVGDMTGDGLPEIKVTAPAAIGGFTSDYLYRIDPAGPTLYPIPFATDELGPDIEPTMLVINAVSPDHARATVYQCEPDCATDPGIAADFVLDRTGTWSLHPIGQAPVSPPPATETLCIRSNIDFAALRATPDLAGDLLAQIPPGSCDVTLVSPTTVLGNGFPWYHVQWNGVDGWTARSNTA